MFPHEIKEVGVSAIQVPERLVQLHAERALAEANGLAVVPAYMDDLHKEIEAIDRLYVLYAEARDRGPTRRSPASSWADAVQGASCSANSFSAPAGGAG